MRPVVCDDHLHDCPFLLEKIERLERERDEARDLVRRLADDLYYRNLEINLPSTRKLLKEAREKGAVK